MDEANERQHGGNHYGKTSYQHWDWVSDTKMHYLAGCASKYVYRRKGPSRTLDLEKAVHYLDKAVEKGITGAASSSRSNLFWNFVVENNVNMIDASILWNIMEGNYQLAKQAIQLLIES